MIDKKMIKKYLLTCSVILVLTIIFHLSFGVAKTSFYKRNVSAKPVYISYKYSGDNTLNFADEMLPKDKKVKGKMTSSLRRHSFGNVQSEMLHRKAEKMFPVIEPILQEYGIPNDFKFIPLVESGFSEGRSPRGAYGPWQFMAGTARTYGLKVDKRHDERTNLRKATIAACKYLLELHDQFKSWTLVAAAYNTGSPNLARLIRKQSQKNYYRIKMNRETGVYVYNLIAMKQVINDPQGYGYNYHKPVYAYVPGFTDSTSALN
ncbi:lytic transglycosylase domain-containing protein [Mucilaginibacter sp. HMF5004]|uniref:lytic transglycosylase domain-containing protein n=1 Tax=Mucilaginibacter rivuli TaxID=2857527 RepID=UPI001C5FB26D|nr:lytic transglycosylase domain-containing protein [Mucilaginibacter rivuli]MBW4891176.1 lytic transglycosylase domain-containing protein [Mucilaginibacter rivuli]